MEINIKNCPKLFNDTIFNIKNLDSSLLEINKLSFKGVFSVSIYYIKYIPTKSPNLVSVYRTDNDEDFLHLLLDDVDGHTEENDGIKYLVFASTDKNKEALKNYKNSGKKLKDKLK